MMRNGLTLLLTLAIAFSATAARAQCGSALDDDALRRLVIPSFLRTLELPLGGSARLTVVDIETSVPVTCVTWSLGQPEGSPGDVTVDPGTGVVTIGPTAYDGLKFTVVADVDNGRKLLARSGLVFDPAKHPLVGVWQEESRYSCETGEQVDHGPEITSLELGADGTFVAAAALGDGGALVCGDQGRYAADSTAGTILFQIDFASVEPIGVKASGKYRIDAQGRLVLEGVSFGNFCGKSKRACRYVFTRISGRPN